MFFRILVNMLISTIGAILICVLYDRDGFDYFVVYSLGLIWLTACDVLCEVKRRNT